MDTAPSGRKSFWMSVLERVLRNETVVPRAVPEQFTDAALSGWKLFYIRGTVRGTTELKIERKYYYGRGFLQSGV